MNFFKHLILVLKHKWYVFRLCCMAGIPWRGLVHDLSKFTPVEFCESVKYFNGHRSPLAICKETEGYSKAWLHHKGRNKHHFEYWTDYHPETRQYGPVKMPIRYVKEMFCDRVAASKIYQGDKYTDSHPIEYFLRGKGKRIIHPETSDLLEKLLKMLAEQGEDKTFKYIKNLKEY